MSKVKKERQSQNPMKSVKPEKNKKVQGVQDITDVCNTLSSFGLSASSYSLIHKTVLASYIRRGLPVGKLKDPNLSTQEILKFRNDLFKKK